MVVRRIVCKLAELLVVACITTAMLLAISGGRPEPGLQAGTTAGGDPCSSYPLAGDANGSDSISISDALHILQYLFQNGADPVPVCEAGGTFTDEEIDTLKLLAEYLSVINLTYDDVDYPTLRLTGANFQVVNGLDATNGLPDSITSTGSDTVVNGLGNIIVGYNELRTSFTDPSMPENYRTGSHNLIVGTRNSYDSFGCAVFGRTCFADGAYSSVPGGFKNTASAVCSSVVGGCSNTASARYATVCGGHTNTASGAYSTVVGGGGETDSEGNLASAAHSVVVGGRTNAASGECAVVGGGMGNEAAGFSSVVAGGGGGLAGEGNAASADFSCVAGGRSCTASGVASSVGGGLTRTADGDYDWTAGTLEEEE